MMSTAMEDKSKEIAELKEQIKAMERRLAGSLKGLLLWSDETELAASHKVQWFRLLQWYTFLAFPPPCICE